MTCYSGPYILYIYTYTVFLSSYPCSISTPVITLFFNREEGTSNIGAAPQVLTASILVFPLHIYISIEFSTFVNRSGEQPLVRGIYGARTSYPVAIEEPELAARCWEYIIF